MQIEQYVWECKASHKMVFIEFDWSIMDFAFTDHDVRDLLN